MSAPERRPINPWAGLALLALPTALLGLDVTVLYLVLPSITADLAPSTTETLWIMDSYGFFIAGFLITMGTLGDRVGRRRLLMIGITSFAAVSVLAAFAPSAPLLILARSLLGVAGATLMPSTLSLISNMFTDAAQRAVAIGIWATTFAIGMAAGPVVGGALVDRFWWGAAFLLALPVAAIVLTGARRLLPEYSAPDAERLDLTSVALSLLAILPVMYSIKTTAAYGPDPEPLVALAIGLLASTAFVRRQRHLSAPMVDLSLLRERTFSAALAVMLIGLVGVGGTMFLVTQYLQLVEGLSPVDAGLAMGPPAGLMVAGAIGAPFLARKVRPAVVMATTLSVSVLGYLLLLAADVGSVTSVIAGFGFVYLGLGTIAALGTDLVVGAAPRARAGSGAAMSESVQELGIAAGVAVLGSVSAAVYRSNIVLPGGIDAQVSERLADSLGGAISVSTQVSPADVEMAREAFTTGFNVASGFAGVAIAGAAALCLIALRHVGPFDSGATDHAGDPDHVR